LYSRWHRMPEVRMVVATPVAALTMPDMQVTLLHTAF
jgi:hypothetical protein